MSSSPSPSVKTVQIRAVDKTVLDGLSDIIVEVDGRCQRCGCSHPVIAVYLCKKCGSLLCEKQIIERKMTAVGPKRHRTVFLHVIHSISRASDTIFFPRTRMKVDDCGPCTLIPTKSGLMFDMEMAEIWEAPGP